MINTLLRAKHWQLFSAIYGAPFLIYLLMVYQIFSSINNELNPVEPDPFLILGYMKYLLVFAFISMIVYWIWYWSVGVGLQNRIPKDIEHSPNLFKVFLIFPAVYLGLVSIFALTMINQLSVLGPDVAPNINPLVITLIIPVHLFSVFCIFYCIYFVAKTIKTVELQRKVTFSDFIAEFFLVWFFPIGIWILQPTINKLVNQDSEDNLREYL